MLTSRRSEIRYIPNGLNMTINRVLLGSRGSCIRRCLVRSEGMSLKKNCHFKSSEVDSDAICEVKYVKNCIFLDSL